MPCPHISGPRLWLQTSHLASSSHFRRVWGGWCPQPPNGKMPLGLTGCKQPQTLPQCVTRASGFHTCKMGNRLRRSFSGMSLNTQDVQSGAQQLSLSVGRLFLSTDGCRMGFVCVASNVKRALKWH